MELYNDANELIQITKETPSSGNLLHPDYSWTEANVIHAVRYSLAQKVEDVISRRIRALPLNTGAADQIMPRVAELMAEELEKDKKWIEKQTQSFSSLLKIYRPNP